MNSKGILFSTPMVKAILDGTKTQTRRVIKPQPYCCGDCKYNISGLWYNFHGSCVREDNNTHPCKLKEPRYNVGDILYVRETWQLTHFGGDDYVYIYYEDYERKNYAHYYADDEPIKWKPSIHMPKAAARIFFKVTAVKVERVQDISTSDAIAEGMTWEDGQKWTYNRQRKCENAYVSQYADLWDSLNAIRGFGWDDNPWVWAYMFERIEKPEVTE